MNKIILAIFLVLTFSVVFADCETTLDKLERMDISYTVLPNGNADMTVVLVANYSKDCLLQRFIEGTDQNLDTVEVTITSTELECPSEFLEDYVDTEIGNFDAPLTCATTFVGDDNHIRMNFTGTAIQFAKLYDSNRSINMGGGIFFVNAPADSSLTINIPANAMIADHRPRSGEKTTARIYWYPLPSDAVYVRYVLESDLVEEVESPFEGTPLEEITKVLSMEVLMLIILAGMIVLIVGFGIASSRRKVKIELEKKSPKDLETDAQDLKKKMQSLESAYMKGSIEETTYRRLMEQYQLQLNDLRVQLKKRNK